jgi:hypothetical protein
MKILPWHKFYTDKFMATMHKFPNHIIGKWMRVFCTMADSKDRWFFSGRLEDWSRILGENHVETRKFINYVLDHFINVRVEMKVVDSVNIYSMTDLFYKFKYRSEELDPSKILNGSINYHRDKKRKEILEAYHPAKLAGKNDRFKKEFMRLMREASRGVKSIQDRVSLELDLANEILEHIRYLSTTPEWKKPEKLLSLRDYILKRPWATSDEASKQRRIAMKKLEKETRNLT